MGSSTGAILYPVTKVLHVFYIVHLFQNNLCCFYITG